MQRPADDPPVLSPETELSRGRERQTPDGGGVAGQPGGHLPGGQVPHDHRVIVAAEARVRPSRPKARTCTGGGVTGHRGARFPAGGGVPGPDRVVGARRGDGRAVGAEGHVQDRALVGAQESVSLLLAKSHTSRSPGRAGGGEQGSRGLKARAEASWTGAARPSGRGSDQRKRPSAVAATYRPPGWKATSVEAPRPG